MKKLLSIISIFLLSTILIACNNNVHKVSGEVLTSNEELTTAFNVVSNMDATDVLGQTYGPYLVTLKSLWLITMKQL